jgi:hypothetical protein
MLLKIIDKIIPYIKDAVSIFAPIVGLIIAGFGLKTWKRQLRGKSEYEIAKNLLKSTYKYREAINSVRHPFMDIAEMPEPPKDSPQSNEEKKRFYGIAKAYENRWNKVVEVRIEIGTELLEAEVLWGNDIKERYKDLFNLEKKLFINLKHYLNNINPDASIKLSCDEDIIYSKSIGDENAGDEYTNKLNKFINEI